MVWTELEIPGKVEDELKLLQACYAPSSAE
jgi:hypothetical protein